MNYSLPIRNLDSKKANKKYLKRTICTNKVIKHEVLKVFNSDKENWVGQKSLKDQRHGL